MHVIALSWASGGLADAGLIERAAALVGGGFAAVSATAGLWASAELPADDDGVALAVVARQPVQIDAGSHAAVSLRDVAARWRAGKVPSCDDFAPPFALLALARQQGRVVAVADYVGLSHLYYHAGRGVAAVSSSALALARLFELPPAPDALLGLALSGAMIGTDAPFAGVVKLAAGHRLVLRDGQLEVACASLSPGDAGPAEPPLRRIMTGLSQSFPEAELELSGGLDSRLLLAALPPEQRRRHAAFTLGPPGSRDREVAAAIAAREGLRQTVIDPAEALDGDAFASHLRAGARDTDFSSNPLDRVMMAAINARHPVAARFNGSNGETLRGFYFAGQPLAAPPTAALARRLVRWRLLANDIVDPALFEPEWYREARAGAESRLVRTVLDQGGDSWAATLERLYLGERMQRWCGASYSSIQHQRQVLAPFFDRAFVAWALAQPAADKSGSRAAARLLTDLDAGLAALPLDTGMSPAGLLDTGPAAAGARLARHLAKLRRKVAQRFGRSPATTLATADARAQFAGRMGATTLDLAALARLPMFDGRALERYAEGGWQPDRPTLGFIINCALLVEALAAER